MLVKAAEIRITTDDVWFRSAPTTSDNADGSSNAIAELPMGTKVYLIEDKVNTGDNSTSYLVVCAAVASILLVVLNVRKRRERVKVEN